MRRSALFYFNSFLALLLLAQMYLFLSESGDVAAKASSRKDYRSIPLKQDTPLNLTRNPATDSAAVATSNQKTIVVDRQLIEGLARFAPRSNGIGELHPRLKEVLALSDTDAHNVYTIFVDCLNRHIEEEIRHASLSEDDNGGQYIEINQFPNSGSEIRSDFYNRLSKVIDSDRAQVLIDVFSKDFNEFGTTAYNISITDEEFVAQDPSIEITIGTPDGYLTKSIGREHFALRYFPIFKAFN